MNIFTMDPANLLKNQDSSQVSAETRRSTPKTSFSDHVEQKMAADRRRNLLRSQENRAQEIAEQKRLAEKRSKKAAGKEDIAAKLEEFLKLLKEMAQDIKDGPGEWAFPVPDNSILQQIGENAGMSAAEIANLIEQAQGQGGQLGIVDFFDALNRHLQELQESQPVSVPETDLPLLETLLSRMGVPVEDIKQISDESITGDGRLDLVRFLEKLEQVKDARVTALSKWEAEQLQEILGKAGASEQLQNNLLWEKGGPWKSNQWNDVPVVLGLGRLKNMLSQSIQEITANRLKPDVPAFLADLENILSQAGFEDKTVGWSPAVQNSIIAAYRELMNSVDMATVKAGMGENAMPWDFTWAAGLDGADGAETSTNINSRFSLMRITTAMQQQLVEQVSRGMMRGLQNNEHHLILKLQPPELGELRVDLHVNNDKISVTFAMENSQVKTLLESNMQQFQDNLEKQGFVLGEFSASVNQQNDHNSGQSFEFTWENLHGTGKDVERQVEQLDAMYFLKQRQDYHQGQISLIV